MKLDKLIRLISNNYCQYGRNLSSQYNILKNANIIDEINMISHINLLHYVQNNILFLNKQNYNKILIEETDDLKFYLITWNVNALSKLHSHHNECLFKVCSGEIEQTILSPSNNFIKKTEIIKPDDVNFIKKDDFHQMRNIDSYFTTTFHIYDK